ncbi:hypothetical protein JCM5296_002619 [Sporobolomyces johnsonii]
MSDCSSSVSVKRRLTSLEADSASRSATPSGSRGAKRMRPGQGEPDCVLISSDGTRFPSHTRALFASSPIFEDLLVPSPSSSTSASPSSSKFPSPTLPEATLPETAETLAYILPFLYPTPVQPRALEFPRDWEVVKALDKYQVWRGIDAVHAGFLKHGKPIHHAQAYAFGRHFDFPRLCYEVALDAARSSTPVSDLFEGLQEAVREIGLDGESVLLLIGWLSQRAEHLKRGRSAALDLLRAFDEEYECEHSCRGMLFEKLADALATTSKKKIRELADDVDFDCKDCNLRWESVLEALLECLRGLPACPLPQE